MAAPNPFGEDVDEVPQDESAKPEPAHRTTAAGNEGNLSGVTNTVDASSEPAGDANKIGVSDLEVTGDTGGSLPDVTEAAAAAAAAAGPCATSDGASRHILPRSLSVPAITSAPSQGSPVPTDMTEAGDQVTSCQTKVWIKIMSNY